MASIGIRPFIGDLEQQADELAAILRAELLKPKRHVLLLLHCRIGVQNRLVCELQEDGQLGDDLDRRSAHRSLARACTTLTGQPSDPVEYRATVQALRITAQRALAAHQEARQLGKELGTLARAMAPALLAQPGVGPVTGAQVLISWSHPGRLRSEVAFAMLAGAAPIQASSGQVVRHRLNAAATGGSTGRYTPSS